LIFFTAFSFLKTAIVGVKPTSAQLNYGLTLTLTTGTAGVPPASSNGFTQLTLGLLTWETESH